MFLFNESNLDIMLLLAFSLLLLVLFVLTDGIRRLLVAGLFAVFMSILSPALALIRAISVLGSLPAMDSISEYFLPGNRPYARLPTWMYYQSMPVYLLQVAVLSMGVILAVSLLSSGIRLYQERARARAVGFYDLPAFRNPDDRLAGANLFLSGLLVGVTLFHLYWLFVWDRIRDGAGFFLYFLPVLVAILSGVLLFKSLKSGVPPIDVINETLSAGRYKINKPGNSFRLLSLVLLVVAIIGPWTFDRINVPAEYYCDAPFVRLEGDYCGVPILGIMILPGIIVEIVRQVGEFITGGRDLASLSSVAMVGTGLLLILLPVFTTLLLLLKKDGPGLQLVHTVVLVLVNLLGLLLLTSDTPTFHWVLWGMWLYFSLVALTLILEVLEFARGRMRFRGI